MIDGKRCHLNKIRLNNFNLDAISVQFLKEQNTVSLFARAITFLWLPVTLLAIAGAAPGVHVLVVVEVSDVGARDAVAKAQGGLRKERAVVEEAALRLCVNQV